MYILYFSQCHSDIARPNIYTFLNYVLHFYICVYYWELLDTTALLELGTQAITSAKYVYVTNKM